MASATDPADHRHGGCQVCGSLTFSQEWFDVFGVVICNACRREEQLISKSSAKENYMLTDGDLKKLGSVTRSNPRKKDWSAMRLFLQSQCEAAAFAKFGGPDGIEAHRRGLLDVRQERRAQKRISDQKREEKEQMVSERVKRKLEETVNPAERQRKGEETDHKTGAKHRVYEDGVTAELEEI